MVSQIIGGNGVPSDAALSAGPCRLGLVDKSVAERLVYTDAPRPHLAAAIRLPERATCETYVPAQRSSPQAEARLPGPHVDARRTDDPEAPPRQGAQAPLRLSAGPAVERRYRLSRSKDFDAVYRQGRSVSTRYLTLHWFPRDDDPAGEPRLGLAVPKSVGNAVVRNRLKRQLRETWQELAADIPAGRDYVLAARSGVAEPADTRGHDWLVEQVTEVLGKAAA
jgi:ribonuclease P protein component